MTAGGKEKKKEVLYRIEYVCNKGWREDLFSCNAEITTMAHIAAVQRHIEAKKGFLSVVLLNWVVLGDRTQEALSGLPYRAGNGLRLGTHNPAFQKSNQAAFCQMEE